MTPDPPSRAPPTILGEFSWPARPRRLASLGALSGLLIPALRSFRWGQRSDPPALGRFMSEDPVVLTVGHGQFDDRYGYVFDDPQNRYDLAGRDPLTDAAGWVEGALHLTRGAPSAMVPTGLAPRPPVRAKSRAMRWRVPQVLRAARSMLVPSTSIPSTPACQRIADPSERRVPVPNSDPLAPPQSPSRWLGA